MIKRFILNMVMMFTLIMIKMFTLIMINMFNFMMIRGPFPPGFPGLRLPGLRFHPHFGEAKVLKKQN